MSKLNHVVVALELNSASIRTENFLGREFVVAPAVLVRSQVLHNNLGVTLLPAAEITADWAKNWNGIPVLVGPHPTLRGVPVSGREPVLWNERWAGWIFNAKMVQESEHVRHLAGEVWLDKSRAAAVNGLQEVLDKLGAGEKVELSTGFNVAVDPTGGVFQGTAYEAVMHPDGADHLVISTEMTGACSVSDGCGLGVNKFEGIPPMETNTKSIPATETPKELSMWDKIKARFSQQRESAENSIKRKVEIDEFFRSLNELPASDTDRQLKLSADLQDTYGSRGQVCIADVYSDTKQVVFWLMTPLGSSPQGTEYYRANYTEGSDGGYTFDEPVMVRRKTVYEPVGNEAGKPSSGTATNCGCASTEEATMSEQNKEKSAIEKLTETVGNLATAVQTVVADVASIKEAAKADENPAIAGLKQSIGEIMDRLDSMKGVTETAVQERERERQSLVTKLAGHYRCTFTAEELETKPLVELRKIDEMVTGNNYSGKGGPRSGSANNSNEEQRYAAPKPYYEKDKTEGGK